MTPPRLALSAGTTAVLVLVWAVHLSAVWAGGASATWARLADLTQVLLVPALLAWLAQRCESQLIRTSRTVRLVMVALGLSWVGDTLPRFLEGDASFLAMVGGFLAAQIVYVWAFAPALRRAWHTRRAGVVAVVAGYAAAGGALALYLVPAAGALAPAVGVYAAAVAAMAVAATGLGPVAGVGGLVFLCSDAMIGIGAFHPEAVAALGLTGAPWSVLVMAAYVAGQWLLAAATAARAQPLPAARAQPSAPGPAQPIADTGVASAAPEPSRRSSGAGRSTG